MKCFLIRDLLPFYAEGKVSNDTKEIIEKHFQECDECLELYNSILNCSEEIKASEELLVDIKPQSKDREFWRKYYGGLYVRGICLFFAILILVIEVIRLIRYFR
ncbi:zf-HC2 domain-containing protein [Candidatus Clostridium stratigraminis]|uniref:Zf-HC2 domain-containing protein n=1 Tax=Candidatus Clostridium stratigraminis TaxID=3381661 RepID=A0ABW8T8X6_9CLOT